MKMKPVRIVQKKVENPIVRGSIARGLLAKARPARGEDSTLRPKFALASAGVKFG